jgi:choline-glycine betaine transporter
MAFKVSKKALGGGIALGLILSLAMSAGAGAVDLNTGLNSLTETNTTMSRNVIIAIVTGAVVGLFAAFIFGGWKGYSKAKKEQDVDNPITAAALEGLKFTAVAFVAEFLIAFGIEKITNVNLFEKVIQTLFP